MLMHVVSEMLSVGVMYIYAFFVRLFYIQNKQIGLVTDMFVMVIV